MTRDRSLDVAVTGMAARFPESEDLDQWWAALQAGRILTRRLERSDLLDAGVEPELVDDPHYVPVRGYLADANNFDNELFGITPRDAELMDPQARLMLETAWRALEDAGVSPLNAASPTGVYASASGSAYLRRMLSAGELAPAALEQALRGTEPDYLASRIAYRLGLTGPALTVQTACSSSLVAVHTAVQALLNGDCDQAVVVAAGVDFPQAGHRYVPGGILSASGVCRPFDANADGAVAGSGVVCLVLRPLADALASGPQPHGVIVGTAINNDGSDKAGYNAPSGRGQEAVIRAALRNGEVDASSLGYLEAHATGTSVGDPIEWSAAAAALHGMGAGAGQVALGATKANIGHLDAAAGLASLLKALLVVKTGTVPPVAGFSELNPLLETANSPLYVPVEAAGWTGPAPRRAGVSSFGIGGTNAHVIVEQAPQAAADRDTEDARERLVVLSAGTPEALQRSTARLSAHLGEDGASLADVAHTLAAGRAQLPCRRAVTGRTSAQVAERLSAGQGAVHGTPTGEPAPVIFLFPGQGTQQPGMALPLLDTLPGFSQALDTCLAAFPDEQAATLRRALTDADFPAAELESTALAQPALFAVEYAAATALTALGIAPSVLVGHSLGEITAATLAGVLTPTDAARFVTARGLAMQGCASGAMLALHCDEARATKLIDEYGAGLELAAVNGPENCVVAGPVEAIEAFGARLDDRIVRQRLRTGNAFHSALVEPAIPELQTALRDVRLAPPCLPLATNTTGQLVPAGAEIKPDMFAEQARRTVRFHDALTSAVTAHPDAVTVEVGPGRTLSALAESVGLTTVPLAAARPGSPGAGPLAALGELWAMGQPVDPAVLCEDGRPTRLPGYQFAGPDWIAPEALPVEVPTTAPAPSATPAPAAAAPAARSRASTDPRETVARAWSAHLGRSDLTDDVDFFELGGDSLLITRITADVAGELGLDIPVRDMLAARTLGGQRAVVAALLAGETDEEADYLDLNRALWDERVPIHTASEYYDVEGFKRGVDPLREFEPGEVGDVTDKRLAHLQCHIGLDTLAWARRGARVTGLDFSAPAVEQARELAAELSLDARFVTADVYESGALLGTGAYDIVYTGVGALCWLPDMQQWAETVASLLAPGGMLYLSEFHPFADTLAPDGRTVTQDYFGNGPLVGDMRGTYADTEAATRNTRAVAFQHGLGDVVSAVVAAGMKVDFLHEHDSTVFQKFPALEAHADGAFRLPSGRPRVPLMYSLRATKK